MQPDLTYQNAVSNAEKYLIKGGFAKADLFITTHLGRRYIVKDFGGKGFLERNIIGRVVVAREHKAYRSLASVDGLPSSFQRLSPFALAVEYLEGRDLGSFVSGEIDHSIIRQFERIMDQIHERGWVHLDLQKRSNILVVYGKVYVVDLASAFHPGVVPIIGRPLASMMGFFDRLSLIKIKKLFAPELMSPRERRWLRLRNIVMPTKW